jgi:hypothetical protein
VAPVAQAAPFPAERVWRGSEARGQEVPPVAGIGATDISAGTAAPADTGTELAAPAAEAAASILAAAAAPAEPDSGSRPCGLRDDLRETGGW